MTDEFIEPTAPAPESTPPESPPAEPVHEPTATVSVDTDGDGTADLTGQVDLEPVTATPSAPAEPAEPAEPPPSAPDKVRRGRGNLEADVKAICDSYAKGDIKLEDGEYLTPHRIANLIVSQLHEESKPSTGAVAACLKRWVDYGYIVANEKQPFAFLDFTDAARTEGLSALKEKFRAKKKAEGATPEPEPVPAPPEPTPPGPPPTEPTPAPPVEEAPPISPPPTESPEPPDATLPTPPFTPEPSEAPVLDEQGGDKTDVPPNPPESGIPF